MSNSKPVSSAEEPWKDKEKMIDLYENQGYTYAEMADKFGCSAGTVSTWMKKHNADEIRKELDIEIPNEYPYRDLELMETLYLDEKLSTIEISAVLDCSTGAVNEWLNRHGIDTRSTGEGVSYSNGYHPNEVPIVMHRRGQVRWNYCYKGKKHSVYIHRVLAIAEYGFDKVAGKSVHHKNGIPWDNRPSNIELMDDGEHTKLHRLKVTGNERQKIADLYEDTDRSSYDIADEFGVSAATVLYIHDEKYSDG